LDPLRLVIVTLGKVQTQQIMLGCLFFVLSGSGKCRANATGPNGQIALNPSQASPPQTARMKK
jgi:hypothetical protein